MSDVTYHDDTEAQTLRIKGEFGENLLSRFREVLTQVKGGKRCVIDMSDVNYLDSTALGMLIILRERVGGKNADISLVHCNQSIQTILGAANFGKFFPYC